MEPKKKNLLVILCDQLQRHILGPYGGRVQTPNLDKLAARGAVYDNFYCATPLCAPTRPSMMTGRWPHAHGATSFGKEFENIHSSERLLIDHLMDEGYHVGYEGIWHINRHEEDLRTDEYAHFQPRGFPYKQHLQMLIEQGGKDGKQRAHVSTPTDYGRMHDWTFSVPVPARWTDDPEDHPDSEIASNIAGFVKTAPKELPFAAWCSLGGPHPPIVVPEPYYSMYSSDDVGMPESYGEPSEHLPEPVKESPGAQSVRGWTREQWVESRAVYWGFVAFLDSCIGQVLDALEASGRSEDTVVIVTSDHGEMMGAHNLYQKGVLYDESIHIPFILAAGGIEPGHRQQFGSQVDIPATVLQLLGLPGLPNVQGKSLVPSLNDPEAVGEQTAFVEFNGYIDGGIHTRGVVCGALKYIYHHGHGDQLFDLKIDPFELNNLCDNPEYCEALKDLRARLTNWMASTGDSIVPIWT